MSRRKKWLLRIGVGGVVLFVLLPLGVRFVLSQRWQGRLATIVAELDRTDPGWRFADLLAAKEADFPADADNIYAVTEKLFHPTGPTAFIEFDRSHPDWLPPPTGTNLPAADALTAARKTRDESQSTIDRLRAIKGKTRGGFRVTVPPNVMDLDLAHVQRLRHATRLLTHDAAVAAADKAGDRAISDTHAALDVAKAVEGDGTLIELLVRTALASVAADSTERTLAWSEPTAGLGELQAAFLAEADYPLLAHGLRGERAMGDKLFTDMAAGTAPGFTPGGAAGRFVARPVLAENHAAYLEYLTAQLKAAKLPPHERAAAQAAIPDPTSGGWRMVYIRLLLPAVEKVGEADQRRVARLRVTAVALACERHRRAAGKWPMSLADIGKDILPAVPLDPYDGQPLRLFRAEDGLIVYSVGPDGTDDGGHLSRTYRANETGVDYGFRLWDVEKRRAAPLPATKGDEP